MFIYFYWEGLSHFSDDILQKMGAAENLRKKINSEPWQQMDKRKQTNGGGQKQVGSS